MKLLRVAPALLLLLAIAGCRHKQAPVIPVAAQAPVDIETASGPKLPPKVASIPTQPPPVATVPLPKKKPRRPRHKPAAPPPDATETQPAGSEVAALTPPPIATVIGSLTTGEDASPATRQHAADLIASNEKRLKALHSQTTADHRSAVTRVENFDRDATAALKTGDASGAITLATKAQVLLDDLDK